jgi:hypothetical protein
MAECPIGCTCGRHRKRSHSEATKAKIREKAIGKIRRPKGYKHSEATKAKQRESATGRIVSDATKAKLSEIVSASMTPERREQLRIQATGHVTSEATREKLRQHRHTEETKLQISNTLKNSGAHKAAMQSEERSEKISAALTGRPLSEAHKDKLAQVAIHNWRGGRTGDDFAAVLLPAGFIREHYVYYGDYIIKTGYGIRRPKFQLDFAHIEAKVNIELDGESHHETKEQDAIRDSILRDLGWRVIRIKV